MSETKFLTPDEVTERYRGSVSAGTLRNWRAMKIGPSFVKIGKAVLYPLEELEAWDKGNRVQCRNAKRLDEHADDHSQALWTYPTHQHQSSRNSQKQSNYIMLLNYIG